MSMLGSRVALASRRALEEMLVQQEPTIKILTPCVDLEGQTSRLLVGISPTAQKV